MSITIESLPNRREDLLSRPSLYGNSPVLNTLTFEAEGNDDSQSSYFSRRAHHPSFTSGVTIGRGYDMKYRSMNRVLGDLLAASVRYEHAVTLSRGAGLSGERAQKFVKTPSLPELSQAQERALFNISYREAESDVKRISDKPDVVSRYGKLVWEHTDSRIREILIDLRFRGDYTPSTRAKVQRAAVENDLTAFRVAMSDRALWRNVPQERFAKRIEHLGSTR